MGESRESVVEFYRGLLANPTPGSATGLVSVARPDLEDLLAVVEVAQEVDALYPVASEQSFERLHDALAALTTEQKPAHD